MDAPRTVPTRRHRHGRRRRAIGSVALLVLIAGIAGASVQLGFLHSVPDVAAQETETRTVALDEGWNLLGWTGPETPFLDAVAAIVDQTEAAAAFDGRAQAFRNWNASAPALLNSLVTLRQGEAVWLRVSEPVDWVQPVVADPDPLVLHTGFNLVTWMGPSGLEPAESFAGIAAALNAAFAFDSTVEAFTSFGPSRPPFLNDLTPLVYGDGFWALMDAAATWSQPAAPEPAAVSLPDGSVTLEIPRGALPPGVDASDITITDSPDGPRPIVEGADFLLAVQLEPSGLTFATPVLLHLRARLDPGAMPIPVSLSAERGVEFLLGAMIEPDPADPEGSVITVPITHFSWDLVFAAVPQIFFVEPHPFGEVMVGQEFFPEAWVTRIAFDDVVVTITTPADFVLTPPGVTSGLVREAPAKQIVIIRDAEALFQWSVSGGVWLLAVGSAQFTGLFGDGLRQDHPDARLIMNSWRCLAAGPLKLRTVGTGTIIKAEYRKISFAGDGRILSDSTGIADLPQELPLSLVVGTCLAPPGALAFLSESGEFSEEILIGVPMKVLVADPTAVLADPDGVHINVEVWVSSGHRQTLLIRGDPTVVCSTPNVCSGLLRAIDAQPGDTVFLIATDRDGNVIAFQLRTVPG